MNTNSLKKLSEMFEYAAERSTQIACRSWRLSAPSGNSTAVLKRPGPSVTGNPYDAAITVGFRCDLERDPSLIGKPGSFRKSIESSASNAADDVKRSVLSIALQLMIERNAVL